MLRGPVETSEERKSGVTTKTGSFARVSVGRLVEVRVLRLGNLMDVESLAAAVFDAVQRAGSEAVIYSDCRGATPLTGEVANALSQAMRQANGSIARSGILLDSSNTMFNLQVERIVHCAGNEQRRLFTDADELRDWLDGTVTETERAVLRTLLLVGEAGPSFGRRRGSAL
jgi:hypothetical protein